MNRVCIAAFAIGLVAPTASAQEQADAPMDIEAEKHYNKALVHYGAKRFADAASELAAAHELEPRLDILFAWAQSERLAGNCEKAIELYHRLRKQTLPDADKLAVIEGLERCDAFERPARPRPPEKTTATPATPVSQAVDDSERQGSPWYSDWLGNALVAGGVVGIGVGTTMWLISGSQHSDAAEAPVYDEHIALEDRAKRNRVISIVSLAAGAALVSGGVARYVLRDTGTERDVTAAGWLGAGGGGLAIGGRF